MTLGDHLGLASILLAFVGIGVSTLLPSKRWVGYGALGLALVTAIFWLLLQHNYHPITPKTSKSDRSGVSVEQKSKDSTCSNIYSGHDSKVTCVDESSHVK